MEYAKKYHSISSLVPVFGRPGWRKLLETVGAKPRPRRFSRESVKDCYRRLTAELGRVPDRKEYIEKCCSCTTLSILFEGSGWSNLLRSVGDSSWPRTYKLKGPSKTSMLSAFRSASTQLGKAPNLAQYQKLSGYTLKDIRYRFGENAWQEFLKRSKIPARTNPSSLTAKHLIQDFLKLQQAFGRRPSINEYSTRCHTPKVLDRVFGKPGWKNMISAVGAKALPKNIISASHLVDDYIELHRRLGKKPVFEEFRRMQRHSLNVLDRAFGKPGWSNLTIAAQRKMRNL
ncbi:MAG: hypothetical protein AABZ15_13985 [Nitrospirota bacterium]